MFYHSRHFDYDGPRQRLNSGYVNILAHDNTKEYKDAQTQKKILKEIVRQPGPHHPLTTPISADNNIVFINRDSIIRRPREFKTPPPPMYGEEEEYEVDPRDKFYDPIVDPNIKKFDFLDSREGTVSNHYHKYITSKTIKKRKKNKRKSYKRHKESFSDSEQYDTIGELPGLEVQQPKKPLYVNQAMTYRAPQSSGLHRAVSHSPSMRNNWNKEAGYRSNNNKNAVNHNILSRNSSFKYNAPNILAQQKITYPQPVVNMGDSSRRQIRSGAFQRINSIDRLNK